MMRYTNPQFTYLLEAGPHNNMQSAQAAHYSFRTHAGMNSKTMPCY